MMLNWTDRYLQIPFLHGGRGFGGCDCGGLVLLALREEKGVRATDFTRYESHDFRYPGGYEKIGRGIQQLLDKEWLEVDPDFPRPFDLVRFRYGRAACHVGLYVGEGLFLHVEEGLGYARLTPLADRYWGRNFIEFKRHRE